MTIIIWFLMLFQFTVPTYSAKPAAAAPFAPTDLSGLQVWYSADVGSNCGGTCTDGATQSTWADRSGNANNLGACSGHTAPVYHTNKINSLPAVTFNGSSTCLTLGSVVNLQSGLTIFAEMALASTAAKSCMISGVTNSFCYWQGNSQAEQAADKVNVAQLGLGTAAADTSWHQINVNYNNTTANFRINRATDTTISPVSGSITVNETRVGSNAQLNTQWYNGDIAEIIIYNRVLNSTEIGQVETYLNGRYGN